MEMKYSIEEIKEWLSDTCDYPQESIESTAKELYGLSADSLLILFHLIEYGDISACGNEDFDIEKLRNKYPECTDVALISIYDGLRSQGILEKVMNS